MSLAMYLIIRDLMADLNAVGGGFMSQLEWGSDPRGIPLPVADVMESLFNSTFDHNGRKPAVPYATEADVQGLLTMLFMTYLSGGNPPLFMDFRKVWEAWEIKELAKKLGVKKLDASADWCKQGLGRRRQFRQRRLRLGGQAGRIRQADHGAASPCRWPTCCYFPGGGNSVTFMTPAGIEGIAGRMAYSSVSGMFSLIWDEAQTTEVPEKLGKAMCNLTNPTWPHTFVVPKYASMVEYKQYAAGQSLPHDLEPAGGALAALDGSDGRSERRPLGGPAEVHRKRGPTATADPPHQWRRRSLQAAGQPPVRSSNCGLRILDCGLLPRLKSAIRNYQSPIHCRHFSRSE